MSYLDSRLYNFFMLNQQKTKLQLLIVTKIPKIKTFLVLKLSCCWQFKIYEHDKFGAQLSGA